MKTSSHPLTHPHPFVLWTFTAVGIVSISLASILIRMADAPAVSIATYRVTLATVAIGPFFTHRRLTRRDGWDLRVAGTSMLSGLFLSLHFAFWILSLQMTSVASSVSLVSTTPLFLALFSYFVLHRRPSISLGLGILCTTLGSVVVAGLDFGFSARALGGDLLAVAGAVMAAAYLMAGNFARLSLDLASYTFVTYGTASAVLLLCCTLAGYPLTGFSRETYVVMILLAIVPQLIGHTTFNWALRFLSPITVSVLILGEPLGASILAYLFFGETVTELKVIGFSMIGTGIVLAARGSTHACRRNTRKEP